MVVKLASLSKQNLLLEFASLRQVCPEGVFVSLTPGNPTLWPGVLFVRKGPYMPSVLRFQISFPNHFPDQPPLITFSSDIFHPLLAPLTTHSYTHSAPDSRTVSSADEERLPPGGFSLRYGFPQWFRPSNELSSGQQDDIASSMQSPNSITVLELLEYLYQAFNDEDFLNAIPLEAAANEGAYHAWHTYRARKAGISSTSTSISGKRSNGIDVSLDPIRSEHDGSTSNRGRRPGQWNWDGVWEERSRRGIQSTVSEQALFGNASAAEELIRFSKLDATALELIVTELNNQEVTDDKAA